MRCEKCWAWFRLSDGHMCNNISGGVTITPYVGYTITPTDTNGDK